MMALILIRSRKPDLRRSLGMVLQDTHLFTGTVADNIRYGKLDATDEEVVCSCKTCQCTLFYYQTSARI